jgi:hypothetical protein
LIEGILNAGSAPPYNLFIKDISSYINGDCWGILVNDEIIYNAYDTSRSFRDKIIDKAILRHCRTDIHGALLCEINRLGKDSTIDIYLYSNHSDPDRPRPMRMHVSYEANGAISRLPTYSTDFFAS